MPISEAELAALARLAQLDPDPAALARLRRDLERLLEHIERLHEVPVETPTTAASGRQRRSNPRADEPRDSLPTARVVALAPDSEDDFFVVPPVLPD